MNFMFWDSQIITELERIVYKVYTTQILTPTESMNFMFCDSQIIIELEPTDSIKYTLHRFSRQK